MTEKKEITPTTTADALKTILADLRARGESGKITAVGAVAELSDAVKVFTEFFNESFGVALTSDDRRKLLSAGVRGHGFLDVCREGVREMPELLPSWLPAAKLEEEYDDFEQKHILHDNAKRLCDVADDIRMVAADLVQRHSLVFYNNSGEAAHQKVPGAKTIHDGLAPYFKHHSSKGKGNNPAGL